MRRRDGGVHSLAAACARRLRALAERIGGPWRAVLVSAAAPPRGPQTVESARRGAALSSGCDLCACNHSVVLRTRAAAARAGRLRHAFGDQRLRAPAVPARRTYPVGTRECRDRRIA